MNPTRMGDAEMGLPGEEQLALEPAAVPAPSDGAQPA
jgi:hypothetical protein